MTTVFVLSKNGKPLMPTTRCGHVRLLLKQKKARVVSLKPFTIELLYDCPEDTQPILLGIDPGRTNIGLSAVSCQAQGKKVEAVFSAQMETRNKEIPKLMKGRKAFRHQKHRGYGRRKVKQRRACAAKTNSAKCVKQKTAQNGGASKQAQKVGVFERLLPGCEKPVLCIGIKNKEAKFNNRVRPAGWLTPTANHLLQTHINVVNKVRTFLPVTDVVLEVNKFAFMALNNPNIQKWMYRQGPLKGYDGVEDAVSAQQDGHCLFCKKPIDHYHHVVPQSKRGSDTISNIVGLCAEHHDLVHKQTKWEEKLKTKKHGLNKKYGALSVLNQIIPKLCDALSAEFGEHFHVTDGRSTKSFRDARNIKKDHYLDAFCIACSILSSESIKVPCEDDVFHILQFRRHDRQACHQERLDRKYYLDNKLVATNRHKATEQKSDSLEEYVSAGGSVDKLVVPKHPAVYKRKGRIMPGALFLVGKKVKVMVASQGTHNGAPKYYRFSDGTKATPKNCKPVHKNEGIVFA